MEFKYETHCHTALVSACGKMSAEDIVALYLKNGYNGVFITDHFLNGNTTIHQNYPSADYKEKVERFCEGYKSVKKAASGTPLDVFFGFEYSYHGTDILIYGMDEEKLKSFPEILDIAPNELCKQLNGSEYLAVQAHPFRTAGYIAHIRIFSEVEGFEIYNSARNELCNSLGENYANACGLLKTGGSDIHRTSQEMLGGMAFDEPIKNEAHFVELVRAGKGKIFRQKNMLL